MARRTARTAGRRGAALRWRTRAGALARRIGWRRASLAALFALVFGFGFYVAQLYSDISILIEQRRAALTSAIYSAPLIVTPGDYLPATHLLERLQALSYSQVADPVHPGEYSALDGTIRIYVRDFTTGQREYPARFAELSIANDRIDGISDALGVALPHLALEPEVIGRLLPDAPAERAEVSLNELPPYLVKGLLATEDRYFYYHPGFDPIRIVEAAIQDLRAHRLAQGASTITQQLARTFIDNHRRTFTRKFRELAIALVLEMRLSKNEILERYINDVDLGEYDGTPIYGMPLAAHLYFNKDLPRVTPAEAATLIGMIQAPTLYDPRRHPEAAQERRNTVLALMARANLINDSAFAAASAAPVVTVPPAPLRRAPYFTDYVTALVTQLPAVDGRLAGLRVYTTLDPELQAAGDGAVRRNLQRLEHSHRRLRRINGEKLEGSLLALDPRSGAILAMTGGRNYATSQYNRAVSAKRQPGSAFKPIVYLTALDPALSPLSETVTLASILPDRPMSFGGWTPVNYERTYQGSVTVVDALAESLNVPTAYLGSLLGSSMMIRTAHLMGIRGDLPHYLPLAIGAGEVSLLDLSAVYGVFADGGVARTPYAIDSVVDAQGHLIYQHQDDAAHLMSHAIAYLMTGALQQVLKYGTGAGAAKLGLDFAAAGKTGTTEDYHDAYFFGYTRDLVAGTWVGFDQPESIGLSGAQAALPAWVDFMRDAERRPAHDFGPPPAGITMATIDPSTGGLATAQCPRRVALPFLTGTEPARICPVHGGLLASAGANSSGSPAPAEQAQAAPAPQPSPATNSLLGSVGGFFGSLFGHH